MSIYVYVKHRCYCLTCTAMSNFNSAFFRCTKQSSEILILKIEILLEFQSKTNIETTGF